MPSLRTLATPPLAAALVALADCGSGGNQPKYANDGDTGAAAPATQQTLSPNPAMGDSTAGMSRGTGVGNMAGDTAGAFGRAAGTRQPAPGVPASGPPGAGMENKGTGAPQSDQPTTPKPVPPTKQ